MKHKIWSWLNCGPGLYREAQTERLRNPAYAVLKLDKFEEIPLDEATKRTYQI